MERERSATLEDSLRRIPGIASVRIRGDEDSIEEVYVLAGTERPHREVTEDVITTLFARHGVTINPSQVRIAPTRSEEPADEPSSGPAGRRLLFRSVNVYREGHRAEAQVELMHGDQILVGTASGAAVSQSLPRLVAQATMQALGHLLGEGYAIEMLALERRRLGGRRIILSHLAVLRGRVETHLSGSVLITSDPLEATVFSVLDALNRILPDLENTDTVEYEVAGFVPGASAS